MGWLASVGQFDMELKLDKHLDNLVGLLRSRDGKESNPTEATQGVIWRGGHAERNPCEELAF